MTVLVTGAAGHIGGNLIRELIGQDRRVRAMVHSDSRAFDGLEIETINADILDPKSLIKACEGVETVYHLAAQISLIGDPTGSVSRINVEGTKNVVDACIQTGVEKMIHFSSIHAFSGFPNYCHVDESRHLAIGSSHMAYDRSKSMGELEVKKGVEKGLHAVIVNPTGVLGPIDFKISRMNQVLLDLYHRKLKAVVNGGYNWVDVRDVVAGAMAAETHGKAGENYILSGDWVHFLDIARVVQDITGSHTTKIAVPLWVAQLFAPLACLFARIFDKEPLFTPESVKVLTSHRYISHKKASLELGYQPRPFFDTMRDTFEWFNDARLLKASK